jgi:MFS family permease
MTRWLPLVGVIAAVSVYAIAQGLTYPLLSFILERQGHSSGAIGLSAAMTPLGFLCCAPLVPIVARRFGRGRTALISAFTGATLLAAIGWTQEITAWFPLRFLLGVAVLPLYILSEVWIIELAPPERRGRVLGLYTSVISGGFAIGPLTLMLVGTEGPTPFVVGVGAFLGCAICLMTILSHLPDDGAREEKASVRSFLPLAPILLMAVFVVAVLEQASLSLLPVYGLAHGISEAKMSALLGVWIAGSIALQVPFGIAAERWGERRALASIAAVTALGAFLIPFLVETPMVWPLMFVWGATTFGIYTLALVALGSRFTGQMLVAGNAAFALMWGIGGISGPSATGAFMDAAGVEGLPLALGLLSFVLASAALRRR